MEDSAQLWQIGDGPLLDELCAAEKEARRAHSRVLELIAEVDSRSIATKLGYPSTRALMAATLRITRGEAGHRLTQAEDLFNTTTPTGAASSASMPRTAAALAQGDVGVGHVEVIQKALRGMAHLDAEQRARAEELLVTQAREDDPNALARHAGRIMDMVDPDGVPPLDDEPHVPERMLTRRTRRDGTMELKARLDPENAALLEMLLKPFEKPDPEVLDTRGYAERAGDAFCDVLKMAANCPDLPTKNGVRTEVAFTISLDALRDAADDAVLPGLSLFATARELRRMSCDCHGLPVVMGGDSQPLDVAVPAYVVPAHIRRALVLRDRGCVFPSCDRPASVADAHHIRPYLQGGPTKLDNLILLCPHHHRLIHRSEWTVKLTGGRAYFTPPAYIDPTRQPRHNTLRTSTNRLPAT